MRMNDKEDDDYDKKKEKDGLEFDVSTSEGRYRKLLEVGVFFLDCDIHQFGVASSKCPD